ncbi:MAG: tRNA (adenosine(37)-N6)-threonylcarbamoyltransferase complex ATPase subunit type 1 TsaE [Candidatus Magasanikbacteria bacterium RIFOXYA2_FULL_44_8]|uniref:tRNA threonylcarbamoyladenosine biosynthesis protein TsaE n=1 Tax=Candidatus Magasanikbacteria bacterium RIFOXYA2_FULL_44_8 TaxID=1798696 RepID=A0A1F6NKZ3_9BACT|nr:MAG: tRNA (adenosine(37)-N6)-threonylcarbamoyltransferase complex ATPase subunit type 1 TsaE [Candidatus Magasanikbacteria bacterium RIFOXYA2_FULL_44_8]
MKTNSLLETKKIGQEITQQLHGGDILCLYGELGAGKTALTKGLAKGLNIIDDITSPTFTLMNIFDVKSNANNIKKLVHIDTYRLKNEQELIDIGVEDYLGAASTLCVIEWPEKIENLLIRKNIKKITIRHLGGDIREVDIR